MTNPQERASRRSLRRPSASGCAIAMLLAALAFNQFRHIGTPLLWNDESHTVMTGRFTLEYGYPRVTDGRNIVFADAIEDGVYQNFDPELQATTLSIWAAYYWAAGAVWLAEHFEDPYERTAVIRSCFAAVGFLGLLLFWRAVAFRLRPTEDGPIFGVAFLALMLSSVALVLHLKEVRYYPLLFFEGSLLLLLYFRWRAALDRFPLGGFLAVAACMVATFLTFYPAYLIFFAAVGFGEALALGVALLDRSAGPLTKRLQAGFAEGLRASSPLFASVLGVLPTLLYFDVFAKTEGETPWARNLGLVADFFARYEFGIPVCLLVGVTVVLLVREGLRGRLHEQLRDPRLSTAGLLGVAFLAHGAVVVGAPEPNAPFTRYYLLMIPALAAIGVLLALWIRACLAADGTSRGRRLAVWAAVILSAAPHLTSKAATWVGRSVELREPYRGPLDFAIPYLLERYGSRTRDLVLATNYEEASFMYYLDCKVIVGYKANNAAEDVHHVPDVVVYRKWWKNYGELFAAFLARHPYETVTFPVVDYPVNNIPQFGPPVPHRFRTPIARNPKRRLEIHLRRTDLPRSSGADAG